jgi:hypothetical protein
VAGAVDYRAHLRTVQGCGGCVPLLAESRVGLEGEWRWISRLWADGVVLLFTLQSVSRVA